MSYREKLDMSLFCYGTLLLLALMPWGGCGSDDEDPIKINLIATTPESGSVIPLNAVLTLVFDNPVQAVTVNARPATGEEKNWTFNLAPLNLSDGTVALNIGWTNRDGSGGAGTVINLVVDATPPKIRGISGGVRHGATDVDPAPLNHAGITITFDENV